jgi:hypothetical protein
VRSAGEVGVQVYRLMEISYDDDVGWGGWTKTSCF